MNETKEERIPDLEMEISGYCDAAQIIVQTALADLDQLKEIKAMPSIAAATIKGKIDSIQFLLFQIDKASYAISAEVSDAMCAIDTRLKDARLEKGYTEEQLAELAGVTPDAIRVYEAGDRVPRDEIKVKLSDILERPIEYLFF